MFVLFDMFHFMTRSVCPSNGLFIFDEIIAIFLLHCCCLVPMMEKSNLDNFWMFMAEIIVVKGAPNAH